MAVPSLHDQFADAMTSHAVDLQRVEAGIRRNVLVHLLQLEEDLVAQIRRFDIEGAARDSTKRQRAERLIQQTRQTINTAMIGGARKTLDHELLELAEVQAEAALAIPNRILGASVLSTSLTRGDLRTIVSNSLIEGAPSRDWWRKQARDTQMRFATQIRLGVSAGETNQDLVRRIRGTSTGVRHVVRLKSGRRRVFHEFRGGIMDVTTRDANALVRTSVQTVSNEVLDETYKANADVLRGRQALATLDEKTTVICIARDHSAWDMEGNPLPESPRQEPYPGPPPWHWGCRTTVIPLTKSWEELIEEASGEKVRKLEAELSEKTRASMGGPVAAKLDYEEWLRSKPKAFQIAKLGRDRWELWKAGKITAAQLVDQSGRPLSMGELKAKVVASTPAPSRRSRKKATPSKPRGPKLAEMSGPELRRHLEESLAEVRQQVRSLEGQIEDLRARAREALSNNRLDEWRELERGIDPLRGERTRLRRRIKSTIHRSLKVADPTTIEVSVDPRIGTHSQRVALERLVKRGANWVSSITKKFPGDAESGIAAVKVVRILPGKGSVLGSYAKNRMSLKARADTSTVVHELGHHVEEHRHSDFAREFLLQRSEGVPPGDIGWGLRSGILGWKDEFVNSYMGRAYFVNGKLTYTEITSVGIEYLYKDPLTLLERDREAFELIVNWLRGVQ